MGEPEKRKRFRFPLTPPGTIAGRKPPEFDETGLLRMELQGKRGETCGERGEKALGILPVLETHDGVIGIAGHDDYPLGVASPPLMHPEVQCVMQIDIGEQRRDHCSLHHSLVRIAYNLIFQHPGLQPCVDQTQ